MPNIYVSPAKGLISSVQEVTQKQNDFEFFKREFERQRNRFIEYWLEANKAQKEMELIMVSVKWDYAECCHLGEPCHRYRDGAKAERDKIHKKYAAMAEIAADNALGKIGE